MKNKYFKDRKAIEEFLDEVNAQCWRYGYKSQAALGAELGVSQVTAGKYLRDPDDMTFATIRRLVKVLKPNPFLLLLALGYTSKELEQFFDTTTRARDNKMNRA